MYFGFLHIDWVEEVKNTYREMYLKVLGVFTPEEMDIFKEKLSKELKSTEVDFWRLQKEKAKEYFNI